MAIEVRTATSCGMATQTTRNELLATRVAQRQEATSHGYAAPVTSNQGHPAK
jgi:hypothetical protein